MIFCQLCFLFFAVDRPANQCADVRRLRLTLNRDHSGPPLADPIADSVDTGHRPGAPLLISWNSPLAEPRTAALCRVRSRPPPVRVAVRAGSPWDEWLHADEAQGRSLKRVRLLSGADADRPQSISVGRVRLPISLYGQSCPERSRRTDHGKQPLHPRHPRHHPTRHRGTQRLQREWSACTSVNTPTSAPRALLPSRRHRRGVYERTDWSLAISH